MTVEELLTRLEAVAARRGTTTEAVLEEVIARLDEANGPLDAFIACAGSGLATALDVHETRSSVAAEKDSRGA